MSEDEERRHYGYDLRNQILDEVGCERVRQIALGWTLEHDDEHGLEHLYELLRRRVDPPAPMTLSVVKRTLLEVAALAVAGLESIKRKEADRG